MGIRFSFLNNATSTWKKTTNKQKQQQSLVTIKVWCSKVLTSPTLQEKGVKPKSFRSKEITVFFLPKTEMQNWIHHLWLQRIKMKFMLLICFSYVTLMLECCVLKNSA